MAKLLCSLARPWWPRSLPYSRHTLSWLGVKALATDKTLHRPIMKLRGPERDKVGVSWFGLLIRQTSVPAHQFFAAFGVDYEGQKGKLCHQAVDEPTCSAILS